LDALIATCKIVGISAERKNILGYMKRRLPDGSVDPADKSKKQPDGAFKLYHVHDLITLADVTCTHPTTASNLTKSYRSVGCLGTELEQGKDQKYKEEAQRLQFRLQPAGCETYGAPGEGLVTLIGDIGKHAGAEGCADTRALLGWGAPHVREFAWQAVGVGRIRGIASALEASARRRQAKRAAEQPAHGPSASLRRVADNQAVDATAARRARAAARRRALAATRDESVLALPVSVVDHVAALEQVDPHQRVVVDAPVLELEVDFLGPSPAADDIPNPPADRGGAAGGAAGGEPPVVGLYHSPLVRCRPSLRPLSSWWLVVVLAVVALFCLSVAVVVATDRRFEAVTGRVAMLEAELELRRPLLFGFRSCSKCDLGSFG
jgi:hypothetical protein